MSKIIKKTPHSAKFKFSVAIESLKGERTIAELCQEYAVVSSQIYKWCNALLENGSEIFSKGIPAKIDQEVEVEKLHATIGRLKVENDFLAKVLGTFRIEVHNLL
jgi:transposase